MFNWYNKNAPKNSLIRYLSWKYTKEELTQITHLELPEQFDNNELYGEELHQVLVDSPWKASEVKYIANSNTSISSVLSATKDYLFGKKEPNWKNLHRDFTTELISEWKQHGFTFDQTREWINIGLTPQDANFAAWLMDNKQLTTEEVLNYGDSEQLRREFARNSISDSDNETNSLNLPDNSLKTSDSDNTSFKSANSETELPTKGSYHYEFCTDNQALILSWRTPSSFWRDDNFCYEDKYFATDIAKYANSYLKIKTLEPLPRELPTSKFLFSPCKSEKNFYEQASNWTNCWIWEQAPLAQCLNCSTYLTPTKKTNLATFCVQCSQDNETETYSEVSSQEDWWTRDRTNHQTPPTKSFWDDNKNLLIIALLIVLAVIIAQTN